MTARHDDEGITVPRDEFEALKAEVRRLRPEVARQQAIRAMIDNAAGPGHVRSFTRDELAIEWGIGG